MKNNNKLSLRSLRSITFIIFINLIVSGLLAPTAQAFTTDPTSLPESLQNHASVVADLPGPNEKIYVIGGFKSNNQPSNKIYSASLNTDGTIKNSGWTTETATLPAALAFPGVTLIDPGSSSDKVLYVIGGEGGGGAGLNPSNGVYKATIGRSNGVVSSLTQLNSSVAQTETVIDENGNTQTVNKTYAQGNTLYESITLPKKLYGHQVVSVAISNQPLATSYYLYIIGGAMPEGHRTIYRAQLDSSYNLVNQNSTSVSSAFESLSTQLPIPLIHHQGGVTLKDKNNSSITPTIVISGGLTTSGTTNKIYPTRINSDGTLSSFIEQQATLPEPTFMHGMDIAQDGSIIIVGGKGDTTGKLSTLNRTWITTDQSVNTSLQGLENVSGGTGSAVDGLTLRITKSGKTILLGGQKEQRTDLGGGRIRITNPLINEVRGDTITTIKSRTLAITHGTSLPPSAIVPLNNPRSLISLNTLSQILNTILKAVRNFGATQVYAAHTCTDPSPCADQTWTTNTTVSPSSTNDKHFNAVAINSGATLTLSNTSTFTFQTHGWTIGDTVGGTTGTISFNGTQQVTINTNGNTMTVSGTGGIGNITHTANTDTASPWVLNAYVNLNLTGNLTVSTGGTMNVNGLGYTDGKGPGKGSSSGGQNGGGGYGGSVSGGSGGTGGGSTYGSLSAPD